MAAARPKEQGVVAIDVGAPGTIYLMSLDENLGEMIIANAGRVTQKKTILPSIGQRTVTEYFSSLGAGGQIDTLRDINASFLSPDHLRGLRIPG
jgi:hypothetical protein